MINDTPYCQKCTDDLTQLTDRQKKLLNNLVSKFLIKTKSSKQNPVRLSDFLKFGIPEYLNQKIKKSGLLLDECVRISVNDSAKIHLEQTRGEWLYES